MYVPIHTHTGTLLLTAIDRQLKYPWLSSMEMDTVIRVQILDEFDCISQSANTLGKGMNPVILPPIMGK